MPISAAVKTSVTNRVFIQITDLVFVFLLAAIVIYPLGPLLGFLYSILGDGMNFGPFKGQSIGKKLFKLQVVHAGTKTPATLKESALRNAPVGVATFFGIIPIWGWIILGLIGIPLMVMEIYLMLTVETGHRLGDVMGDTEVIDIRG